MTDLKAETVRPIGSCCWWGTYRGCPAVLLSFFGGAMIGYCNNGKWERELFNSVGDAENAREKDSEDDEFNAEKFMQRYRSGNQPCGS